MILDIMHQLEQVRNSDLHHQFSHFEMLGLVFRGLQIPQLLLHGVVLI